LANTYGDSGKYNEAIKYYEKRIIMGGWDQEIWYSYYKMGHCYKNMEKISDAIYCWLNGYNFLPERLEGLYEIIKHYRITNKHKLAKHFYETAKNIISTIHPNVKDTFLFLHNDVYTYKLYYEYTIFASYLNIKNINDEIIIVLNKSNDIIPKYIRMTVITQNTPEVVPKILFVYIITISAIIVVNGTL
jgi:tetratricopeptide (TPR) repeat protein